jgi:transposase
MGLVPKQYSTGGKTKLYGISKRGNSYGKPGHNGAHFRHIQHSDRVHHAGGWVLDEEINPVRKVRQLPRRGRLRRQRGSDESDEDSKTNAHADPPSYIDKPWSWR